MFEETNVYLKKRDEILRSNVQRAAKHTFNNIQKRFQLPLDWNTVQAWLTARVMNKSFIQIQNKVIIQSKYLQLNNN